MTYVSVVCEVSDAAEVTTLVYVNVVVTEATLVWVVETVASSSEVTVVCIDTRTGTELTSVFVLV